jgi:hypothetical protein
LRLVLAPSPAAAAVIVVLHCAAGAAASLVVPGPAGAALGAALGALGLAAAWRRALLRSPRSARALELGAESIVVELANGQRRALAHPSRCHVSRLAVLMPAVAVSADMLGAAEFRTLRIWALWGRLPAVAGKQLPA